MEKIINKILENRGIKEKEAFFSSEISSPVDPFVVPGIKQACEIIKRIIEKKENVFVYGDGDVDGIFGTYFIIKMFEKTGTPFSYYLTHRLDTYEIEEEFISYLKKENISLFITVDCGISSVNFLKKMEDEKIKVIVIDHHIFDIFFLPKTHTYINPKLYNTATEIKYLSSTALAQKLSNALSFFIPFPFEENIELVALSTIADNCPVIGENRKLIMTGLDKIFSTEITGLASLIYELKIKNKNLINQLKMKLIPKLNSPGRFGKPEIVLDLLLSENVDKIIKEIKEIDRKRYQLTKIHLTKFREKAEKETFLVESEILPTICGIISSRLSYEMNKPIAIASERNGIIQGSARCPELFNLFDFIKKTKNYMLSSGGHQQAIGFTFDKKFLNNIKEEWENFLFTGKEENFYYDAEIELVNLTPVFLEELSKFAPFGPGNPEVVFLSKNIKVEKIMRKTDEELTFWVRENNSLFECITKNFNGNKEILEGNFINIYYIPKYRENNGLYRIYLLVKKVE